MKNKILKIIKRKGLLIWITAVAMCMISFIGFAEYQSETYMKRVVVSASDQGMMFSSNYLVEGGETTYQAKPETASSTNSYDVNVYLWNHSLKNSSLCYPGAIDYTVSLRLTDIKGTPITDASVFSYPDPDDPTITRSRSITVKRVNVAEDGTTTNPPIITYNNTSDLSNAFTFNDSIADGNGSAKQTQYIVTYENWDLAANKDICIQMIAKPNRTKHNDLRDIAAVIGLKVAVDEESSDWKASISEIQDNRTDVDGYNLVLSGSGSATIVLKWNNKKIDVNKYFRTGNTIYDFQDGERSEVTTDGNVSTMTINANANEIRNRYDIQLYLFGKTKPSGNGFFAKEDTSSNPPVVVDGTDAFPWITYSITQD